LPKGSALKRRFLRQQVSRSVFVQKRALIDAGGKYKSIWPDVPERPVIRISPPRSSR
jgi:hypothetical protein